MPNTSRSLIRRCTLLLFAVAPVGLAAAQSVSSVRVMTFNVWGAEGSASGRQKLVEIIQTAQADIVGVQELDSSFLPEIAAALGFYYHQQSGGDIQVLSRYPVVGQSPGNLGVQVELSPGQNAWVFNAHLPAYPYEPYDLRDGVLPMNEGAVIASANRSRGAQVGSYLSDMAAILATGQPLFLTGDFNEPSHLDWTEAAALATPRSFDLKVEYPASKRITDVGFVDSFRAVRPDAVGDRAATWTPGYPPPNLAVDEVHDRIDLVYHAGEGVFATGAWTYGLDADDPDTDVGVVGYNSDHRAVAVSLTLPDDGFLFGDLNGDALLNSDDWAIFREGQLGDLTDATPQQAYRMGDLNGDYRNDHADLVLFKSAYRRFQARGVLNAGASTGQILIEVPESATLASALTLTLLIALSTRCASPKSDAAPCHGKVRWHAQEPAGGGLFAV